MAFEKKIGRIQLVICDEGSRIHDYGHGCDLRILSGWNDSCDVKKNSLSVKELIDLRYMIDRALVEVGAKL